MDFNPISTNTTATAASAAQQTKAAENKAAENQTENKNTAADTGVVYEKGSSAADSKVTYDPSAKKSNSAIVAQLKADAEQRTSQLQSIVQKMLTQQGSTLGIADSMWSFLASGKFTVDAKTKAQAQKDIADDGYWGVNQTSDRIVDFAKALSGNDPDKADELLEAVKKGFKQATKSWGRKMPDITQRTYDAVEQKFDEWKKSGKTNETVDPTTEASV